MEIALLRILDSLYKSIDTTHLTTLIGLDLSAAFDTISRSILLETIRDEFGVSGAPLRWLQSYLTDRRHYVKLGRHCSSAVQCSAGVPQGSVLGPILFAAYTSVSSLPAMASNTTSMLTIRSCSWPCDIDYSCRSVDARGLHP